MIVHICRTRLVQVGFLVTFMFVSWLVTGSFVRQDLLECPEGQVAVCFKFLTPMKPSAVNRLVIERITDGQRVPFHHHWVTANTLHISFPEREYPRGLRYRYQFKMASSMIWPFYVWSSGEWQSRVKLRFIGIENQDAVPSRGPVVLQFNTPVQPSQLPKHIILPEPGKLEPFKNKQTKESDFSRWLYYPDQKMKNRFRYTLEIKKGLSSLAGDALTQSQKVQFLTSPEFNIQQMQPKPGSTGIWLTRTVSFTANQPLKKADIVIPGLRGQSRINGNQVSFIAEKVMLPDTTYSITATLTSVSNEVITYRGSFHTTNLGNNRWVELKLGPSPALWVYQGNKITRSLKVNLHPQNNIPIGTLYEQDRGVSTAKAGAPLPWFRLNADILLHVLPEGLADNHALLGLPASYSCLYLPEKDLDWLIQYLPPGFMLIAHE
ncbi:Ig-like domain-containing protein [Desulforamulus ruminis]|uniref:Ig-like domain-containing protein n=1 Tax=Desulforamulus ruminis TaxID=1564 RepID=UPI002357B78C|nr:Ig-like domain-containing protein [Desulforamulus ruminis]